MRIIFTSQYYQMFGDIIRSSSVQSSIYLLITITLILIDSYIYFHFFFMQNRITMISISV